jgi:hypothetical protein
MHLYKSDDEDEVTVASQALWLLARCCPYVLFSHINLADLVVCCCYCRIYSVTLLLHDSTALFV